MILISQAPRSGGTLLQQLLDDHPELLTHPFELEIGPRRSEWPLLSDQQLRDPHLTFEALYERSIDRFIMEGLSPHLPGSPNETRYPFRFSRDLCRRAFVGLWSCSPPSDQRQAIDIYFAAFWAAWRDHPRDWLARSLLAAFRPGTVADSASMTRFFADFPDGRLISIVREPSSWLVSARSHKSRYRDLTAATTEWAACVRSALELHHRHPDRVHIATFESLVGDTASFTRRLAEWIGIAWSRSMLEPTMGGRVMKADSHFTVAGSGIQPDPLRRGRLLSAEERDEVDLVCGDLYAQAVRLAGP